MKPLTFFILLFWGTLLGADTIKVFAASSTKLAMIEIIEAFKKTHPNDTLNVTFSATGKAYAQFTHGFDYDVFIAADSTYPQKIVSDGASLGDPVVYALGTVALFSRHEAFLKEGLEAFKNPQVRHISIANPKLAPYGKAAMEIIKNAQLETIATPKLVLGDNIAQSVQFVDTGAADMGLVAFSLIKSSKPPQQYRVIDARMYDVLEQSFVLTKYAKNKPLAFAFAAFLTQEHAREIFHKQGFETP